MKDMVVILLQGWSQFTWQYDKHIVNLLVWVDSNKICLFYAELCHSFFVNIMFPQNQLNIQCQFEWCTKLVLYMTHLLNCQNSSYQGRTLQNSSTRGEVLCIQIQMNICLNYIKTTVGISTNKTFLFYSI